jgi:aromatic ring hydroxylase
LLQDIGSQGLVNVPSRGNLEDPTIGPILQHVFSNPVGSAHARALAFGYAFDLACSSFGGRQTLFELFNALPWTAQRAQMVRRFDFDPYIDLAKAATGIITGPDADSAALAAASDERGTTTDYDQVGAVYRDRTLGRDR